MKRCLLALTSLVLANVAFAAGTVEERRFFSNALGESAWVQVYEILSNVVDGHVIRRPSSTSSLHRRT
jgi:hypothetical protein